MAQLQKYRPVSEARLSPSEPPRRRIDRETTPGRCGNLDYCSIGMQRVQVRVPISEPFVCPECGGRLRPPGRMGQGRRPWMLPAVRLGVLVTAIGASLGLGYSLGRVQPVMHQAVQSVALHADAGLNAAGSALGLDNKPPAPAPVVVPAPAKPSPIFVAERAFPLRAMPVDVTNPAARLDKEAKFGQVTIDCRQDAILTHPSCHVVDIRGADPFSAAAITWLQSLTVQYAPTTHNGKSSLLDHRWRVVLQDFSGRSTGEDTHKLPATGRSHN